MLDELHFCCNFYSVKKSSLKYTWHINTHLRQKKSEILRFGHLETKSLVTVSLY